MAIDTTNLVKFSRGSWAGYQTLVSENKINNNTVYITQDEGGIYLDVAEQSNGETVNKRVRV